MHFITQPPTLLIQPTSMESASLMEHLVTMFWSYVAGLSEGLSCIQCNCPCADPSNPSNVVIPSFLGDNQYCESGNPTNTYILDHLYSTDPLWDGEQCEGECCSNGESPPWFSVELPNPTTDDNILLRCVFVIHKVPLMTLQFNCWKSTSISCSERKLRCIVNILTLHTLIYNN